MSFMLDSVSRHIASTQSSLSSEVFNRCTSNLFERVFHAVAARHEQGARLLRFVPTSERWGQILSKLRGASLEVVCQRL